MVNFTVMLDGLTEGDVVEVERCLTSARVARPGLATHPFNQQLRQARDRQLHGTFTFEFPCPNERQRLALHALIGAANAAAQTRRLSSRSSHRRQCEHPVTVSSARPLLRGYLHAGAAVVAALGGTYLVVLSSGDQPRQLSMLVYGVSLTLLFAVSAHYHLHTWAPARRAILRRIDHANIFVLIAATYTPLAFNLLSGWWRVAILGAVWGAALVGVGAAVAGVQLRRW